MLKNSRKNVFDKFFWFLLKNCQKVLKTGLKHLNKRLKSEKTQLFLGFLRFFFCGAAFERKRLRSNYRPSLPLPHPGGEGGAGVRGARGLVNTREHLESLLEALELGVGSIQEFLEREPRFETSPGRSH